MLIRSITSLLTVAVLVTSCAATDPSAQSTAEPESSEPGPPKVELHPYLARFVGRWRVKNTVPEQPGQQPMTVEAQETVEALGPWILSRITATKGMVGFGARLAIAYDEANKEFVGNWVDSSSTVIWSYRCWIHEDGETFTAEAEGPAFDDPSRRAKYQDITKFVGADRRELLSRAQLTDGTWTVFSSGVAERVK